jgi:hypothetical protein
VENNLTKPDISGSKQFKVGIRIAESVNNKYN